MLPAPTLRSPGLVVWHVHAAEMQRFDDARGAGRVSAVGQSNPAILIFNTIRIPQLRS